MVWGTALSHKARRAFRPLHHVSRLFQSVSSTKGSSRSFAQVPLYTVASATR